MHPGTLSRSFTIISKERDPARSDHGTLPPTPPPPQIIQAYKRRMISLFLRLLTTFGRTGVLLCLFPLIQMPLQARSCGEKPAAANEPDADIKEFRLVQGAVERSQTIHPLRREGRSKK